MSQDAVGQIAGNSEPRNPRPPRKIFSVIIHKKEYDVYDIEGKEHEGWNGEPKTWWLYYADRLPDDVLPPLDSENWERWHSSIQRHLFDIRFTQSNSTKIKWDDRRFSSHTEVQIWCNNKHIYSFGTTGTDRGLAFAFSKAQYLITVMGEHSFDFFNQEKENGRKIWWHGLPATIRVSSYPGEIGVIPDYTTGLSKEEWWKELRRRESKIPTPPKEQMDDIEEEHFEESKDSDYINWGDALSDKYIDWFRK